MFSGFYSSVVPLSGVIKIEYSNIRITYNYPKSPNYSESVGDGEQIMSRVLKAKAHPHVHVKFVLLNLSKLDY